MFFNLKGQSNAKQSQRLTTPSLTKIGIDKAIYSNGFKKALSEIKHGNSFLLNLTFPSPIELNGDLEDVFFHAKSPYKLLWKDRFTCFSPECFIRIQNDHIYTYPMKGTISADLPNEREILMHNQKEIREHNTIVDLMRNDLSRIAKQVTVTQFRYIEKITTNQGELLQSSSEIRGRLPSCWHKNLGTMLFDLLPAGSVSGAPKDKTTAIIRQAELGERGYYCGFLGFLREKISTVV